MSGTPKWKLLPRRRKSRRSERQAESLSCFGGLKRPVPHRRSGSWRTRHHARIRHDGILARDLERLERRAEHRLETFTRASR